MAHRHLTFVQYGDYAEAVERMSNGLPETYAAQYHSVGYVEELPRILETSVISLMAPRIDRVLPSGVRAIGLGWTGRWRPVDLVKRLETLGSTDIVLRTPMTAVLVWALLRGRRVLPLLADSFDSTIPPTRVVQLKRQLLVHYLNSRKIQVVANHNRPASRDLIRLGVDARKVVPWDWPALRNPEQCAPKTHPSRDGILRITYAGGVSVSKGVGDLIAAIAKLKVHSTTAHLSVAGDGDLEEMMQLARQWGVESQVSFLGRVANAQVFQSMRDSDFVVVPSRHSYPEGLPMTIYEGLCSRTPLLVSDHPMFVGALKGSPGVRFFRAADPDDLANAIESTAQDHNLYHELSTFSAEAWKTIQVPLAWKDLLDLWLDAQPASIAELRKYALDPT